VSRIKRLTPNTYVHWLADVNSGSFAPAFTLSFHDSELKISEANAPANETSRATVTGKCSETRLLGVRQKKEKDSDIIDVLKKEKQLDFFINHINLNQKENHENIEDIYFTCCFCWFSKL